MSYQFLFRAIFLSKLFSFYLVSLKSGNYSLIINMINMQPLDIN